MIASQKLKTQKIIEELRNKNFSWWEILKFFNRTIKEIEE